MTFVSGARLATSLGKVADDWKVESAALNSAQPSTAVVVSTVGAKYANWPHTSLHDLFHNAD